MSGDPEPAAATCSAAKHRAAPFVALVAGALVRGAGHWTGCEPRTARRLLGMQAVGVGALILGGGGLVATGASRKTVAPFASLAILGAGGFFTSWLSDLYGTISRGRNPGRPAPWTRYELAAGYRYVSDPQFGFDHFLRLDGDARIGRARLFGEAWLSLDDDTQRARVGVSQRVAGAGRGAFLRIEAAAVYQRFASSDFQTLGFDLLTRGRFDLGAVGPTLAGSFVEGELGLGLSGFGYQATGGGVSEDWNGMLLGRVGYGVYLGQSGEVAAYYDHRRDDLAGGLSVDSVAAGVLGHFGVAGRGFFHDGRWGLRGELEYGSAFITGLSLIYRGAPLSAGGAR